MYILPENPAEAARILAQSAVVLKQKLEELGMTVTHAMDGKQAVELFTDSPAGTFDVILMDIMMPRMNGYEAARAIRSIESRPDGVAIPIIAMTANAFEEDRENAFKAGMDYHLAKPIVMPKLMQVLKKVLL